jgi:hypothetical protein
MGQVTIYLDDAIESKMRAPVKAMNLSKSKWIANLIKEKVTDEWPESVRKLAGSWKDFPPAEEIRQTMGKDILREEF